MMNTYIICIAVGILVGYWFRGKIIKDTHGELPKIAYRTKVIHEPRGEQYPYGYKGRHEEM